MQVPISGEVTIQYMYQQLFWNHSAICWLYRLIIESPFYVSIIHFTSILNSMKPVIHVTLDTSGIT